MSSLIDTYICFSSTIFDFDNLRIQRECQTEFNSSIFECHRQNHQDVSVQKGKRKLGNNVYKVTLMIEHS